MPTPSEQEQIVHVLDSISRSERVSHEELGALVMVKSALASVLLTGEVRVTVDQVVAA
jgi:hypothetical protein